MLTEQSKELKVLLKRLRLYRRPPTSKSSRQYRVMNSGLQIHTISKMLERKGIASDLVDLRSLVDKRLTLPENIVLISEAVCTSLRVEPYRSEKGLLKEQSDIWIQYMRDNHLTHYVAYKRDGKTTSDKVGEPIHGFLLIEYIKNH